jgi:hypothetical protein
VWCTRFGRAHWDRCRFDDPLLEIANPTAGMAAVPVGDLG